MRTEKELKEKVDDINKMLLDSENMNTIYKTALLYKRNALLWVLKG